MIQAPPCCSTSVRRSALLLPEPPDHMREKRTSALLVSAERLSHRRAGQRSLAAGAARSSGPRKGAPVHRPVRVAHAEMHPRMVSTGALHVRLLRARGDAPAPPVAGSSVGQSAPRTRRCTLGSLRDNWRASVGSADTWAWPARQVGKHAVCLSMESAAGRLPVEIAGVAWSNCIETRSCSTCASPRGRSFRTIPTQDAIRNWR